MPAVGNSKEYTRSKSSAGEIQVKGRATAGLLPHGYVALSPRFAHLSDPARHTLT